MKVKQATSADAAKVVLGSAFTTHYDPYDYPTRDSHYDVPRRLDATYDMPPAGNLAFDFRYVNAGQLREDGYMDMGRTSIGCRTSNGASPPPSTRDPFPGLAPFASAWSPSRVSADTDMYSEVRFLGPRSVASNDSGYAASIPPPVGPRDYLSSDVSNRQTPERSKGKWEKNEKQLTQAQRKKNNASQIVAELSKGEISGKSKKKLQAAMNDMAKYQSQIHRLEASIPVEARIRSPKKPTVYYTRGSNASSVNSDVFI